MTYLDYERLDVLDHRAFQAQKPYPWVNPEGLLTDRGYERLLAALPDVSRFRSDFGIARSHGQQSHDRYSLDYYKGLAIPEPWQDFISELRGARYRRFLWRMFGRRFLWLSFYWHYTPTGCSVSPHCDAKRKLGSHIFYFNTSRDWNPDWGGQTLILEDKGHFDRESAPTFESFEHVITTEGLGNRSLLFARREKSWHGVREVQCPQGAFRKVFIVVIDDWVLSLSRRLIGPLKGKRPVAY